jgi:hypothetical protein
MPYGQKNETRVGYGVKFLWFFLRSRSFNLSVYVIGMLII